MRTELPSGTVTFLFTDIEGSTRLLHALGPESYAEALAEHRRLLRKAFGAHGGIEVDTQGDAFFVAFATAPGAIAAAWEAQAALEPGPIRVRIGIHTGTPTPTSEGYVGVDVHRGARVGALAHGGQVLLTEATASLLDAERTLTDLGRHRLKDFDSPVRLLQLGSEAFPVLRSPGAVSLPTPATRFLGREHELFDAVTLVLQEDPAILTVLGPGGTGKTRFALEVARLLSEDAEGGTLFVPLATLRDPALVLPSIAEALGVEGSEPAAIAARVGEKRTHLLLDNLEQLLPHAAQPLAALADAAPSLRLLVTSREALQVAAESRFDLPPLAAEEAVELFLSRARSVRPDVERTPAVETLCERLDRLPLAIELAAARTRLLAPEALLERLSARLDLPAPRDADPRHATLRATIEWSHDLLAPDEQRLFARLAVFRGGCTLEAAEEVVDADLDTLASLLDKSLVRRRTDVDGFERYWMLETIHELAAERLAEQSDGEGILRRHAEWVLAIARATRLGADDIGRAEQEPARVLRERENLRAAIEWAVEHDPVLATEIVTALDQYWPTSAPLEGISVVESLLGRSMELPLALRARLLRSHGGLVLITDGDVERGEARYRQALELFRELGDDASVVGLLARFAVHAGNGGDTTEARRVVAEVRAANESVGNPIVEPQMLSSLGSIAYREGELSEALDFFRRSAETSSSIGFNLWTLWQLDSQLSVEVELGMLSDAERTARRGLELASRLEDRRLMCSLLTSLGLAALRSDDLERAGALWGAVFETLPEVPAPISSALTAMAAPLRDCTDERFVEAVERGRRISLEETVALVLEPAQTEP